MQFRVKRGVEMTKRIFRDVLCLISCAALLSGCNIRIRTEDAWTDSESLPPENNNGFINYSYIERNDSELKITAAAAGGNEPYEYSLSFKRNTSGTWKEITEDYTKKSSFSLPAEKDAVYYIMIKIRDSSDNLCGKVITSDSSTEDLKNTSTVNESEITRGKLVTVNASAQGGKKPYRYSYYFRNSESSVWHSFGEEFGTVQSASFKPTKSSSYTVRSVITDSDSKACVKLFDISVKEKEIKTG